MGKNSPAAAMVALLIFLAGCAWTNVMPVDQHDRITQGLRICEQKPILIVTPSTTQIQFIPNYSKMYAVQFGAFLAKNDFSIKLDNCSVTQLDSKLDTTAIIDLLKTIASDFAPKPPGKATGGDQLTGGTAIMYEFIFDDDGNIRRLKPYYLGRGLPQPKGGGDDKKDGTKKPEKV